MSMLPLQDYQRYGRQMILDGFGLPGRPNLKPNILLPLHVFLKAK